jgi:hypothetical protein
MEMFHMERERDSNVMAERCPASGPRVKAGVWSGHAICSGEANPAAAFSNATKERCATNRAQVRIENGRSLS